MDILRIRFRIPASYARAHAITTPTHDLDRRGTRRRSRARPSQCGSAAGRRTTGTVEELLDLAERRDIVADHLLHRLQSPRDDPRDPLLDRAIGVGPVDLREPAVAVAP